MSDLILQVQSDNASVHAIVEGRRFPLHPLWLRERSPDSKHLDLVTQQRLFNPHILDPDLKIVSAKQESAAVRVHFSDGYSGLYTSAALFADFDDNDGLPQSIVWDASLDRKTITVDYGQLGDPQALVEAMMLYLQYGALILTGVPTDSEGVVRVAEKFGHVRDTNFGKYFEVRTRPQSNDLAYRAVSLGPHTDNPYREPVPGIQLLHCLVNETSGGLSTLVDSLSVVRQLTKEDPEGVALLSRIPVKFRFVDQNTELIERRPMLHLDYLGRPVGVHYSPRLDYLPILGDETTTSFQRARKRLGTLLSDPAYEIRFPLRAGELMMFDNNRVLHGRTSFNPEEGRRHLQGCYIDVDGPRGRYKALKRVLANSPLVS